MKKRKLLIAAIVVFSVLLSSFALYFYQIFYTPNILVDQQDRLFFIESGSSFKKVQNDLFEQGYVKDLVSFGFLARLLDYHKSIKPGRYLLRSEMTNKEALDLFRSGNQKPTRITFTGARTDSVLAERICNSIELEAQLFLDHYRKESTRKTYGFDTTDFISMFLPDTYEVYWNIKLEDLFDRFKKEYDSYWNEKRMQLADSIQLSKTEVITLASIVKGEIAKIEEAPVVAGVYMNRLKKGIPLQADPTLIFALGDYSIKRVLNIHKELDSPYNTYKNRGLPPGPINLPSKPIIDAVLNYERHNYYYFCAKPDFSGYHNFASTLAQHNRNARLWRRALNKARIYR
ncbi:MAG: endolytic transglycosylase MltG [Bacteroidota bacterium]